MQHKNGHAEPRPTSYADAIEVAITSTQNLDELRILARQAAAFADLERANVDQLIASSKRVNEIAQEMYRSAQIRFGVIRLCAEQMARATALSPFTDYEFREAIFATVRDGLTAQAQLGFSEIDWPDSSKWSSPARAGA